MLQQIKTILNTTHISRHSVIPIYMSMNGNYKAGKLDKHFKTLHPVNISKATFLYPTSHIFF